MALKGKIIKIKGDEYTVTDQFIDFENNEEVIILKRPTILKRDAFDPKWDKPTTIFDLGYTKPEDIDYPADFELEKKRELDSKIGHEIDIAIVDQSGMITLTTVIYGGPLLSAPELCKLEFEDGTRRMKTEFLITAALLADEYNNALSNYREKIESLTPEKEIYEKLINDSKEQLPEELDKIVEIFSDFFIRRFNDGR
jgi:predicted nucleic acid-binding OB-fold protein